MTSGERERKGILWTYDTEHRALYVNCLLDPALDADVENLPKSFAWDELPQKVQRAAETLYTETARLFPVAPVRRIRGKSSAREGLLHITHVVDLWADNSPPPTHVRLVRELVGSKKPLAPVDVEIKKLTPTARAAIRELDRFAIASSRRLIDGYLATLIREPVPDRAPSSPIPAFISYRLSLGDVAARLHSALESYGDGAFIAPYLDKHNLRPGDLRRQFREEIGARPVFLALSTKTYAEPGKISADELAFAQKAGVLIVPVLVGSERPTHWPGWKDFASHRFADAAEITAGSRSVARLVEMCLRSR